MGAATFGSGTTLSSNDGADLAISSDGQALTLSLAEMEAVVDAGKSPDLVAAFVFSAVVPVDGAGDGVDIAFAVDVFAGVTEGASGDAMLSVNGPSNRTRALAARWRSTLTPARRTGSLAAASRRCCTSSSASTSATGTGWWPVAVSAS